jgi:hypothetical protein
MAKAQLRYAAVGAINGRTGIAKEDRVENDPFGFAIIPLALAYPISATRESTKFDGMGEPHGNDS